MKKLIIFLIIVFSVHMIYSDDLIKVNVSTFKITDNFDTSLYGGRLEPKQLIKLYAPASGYVTNLYVTEGKFINKNEPILSITRKSSGGIIYNPTILTAASSGILVDINTNQGQEVFEKSEIATIADTSIFKVYLLVSDKEINQIQVGSDCYIQDVMKISGNITKISLLPENKTGLFKVEASFDKNPKLFIGKFVIIELHTNFTKGISVPLNLIYNRYGKTFLYVVNKDTVSMREVKIVNTFGAKVVIEGVKQDEKYVTYSESNIKEGDKVLVEETPDKKPDVNRNNSR